VAGAATIISEVAFPVYSTLFVSEAALPFVIARPDIMAMLNKRANVINRCVFILLLSSMRSTAAE